MLLHLERFTQIPVPSSMSALTISDNLGMITSLTARQSYSNPFPNVTLKTDWDLLEEVHLTYKQLKFTPHQYEWVQSHQDTTTKVGKLSQQAQHNI